MRKWDIKIYNTSEDKPYWRIPTKMILKFFRKNINRIITAFEYVYGLREKYFIDWEYIKLIIIFLRFLKFIYNSHLLRDKSVLWWNHRIRPNGKIYEDLRFSITIPRYGYGWFMNKINWKRYTFKADIAERTLFSNIQIIQVYHRKWKKIKEITNNFLKIK